MIYIIASIATIWIAIAIYTVFLNIYEYLDTENGQINMGAVLFIAVLWPFWLAFLAYKRFQEKRAPVV